MKRLALIIGYPGEDGDDDYLEGVNGDMLAWKNFLSSPMAGKWNISEIKLMLQPSAASLNSEIEKHKNNVDYALLVFTGHGGYSAARSDTVLQLNKNETFDSKNLNVAKKQTVILDCCRKEVEQVIRKSVGMELFESASQSDFPNPQFARAAFETEIKNCDNGIIIIHSCNIGEYAYDDEFGRGGRYTFSLLNAAMKWRHDKTLQPNHYAVLSVPAAHNNAVEALSTDGRYEQTPRIAKARSGPYFPFCVWV